MWFYVCLCVFRWFRIGFSDTSLNTCKDSDSREFPVETTQK